MPERTPRVALLHTGAVVIPPAMELLRDLVPGATAVNYLDDRIVADLADPERRGSVAERVAHLASAAKAGGADVVVLTCSSISQLAAGAAEAAGIPVLRIDEAMADAAVRHGDRIVVLATVATTCEPTTALVHERAALAGRRPEVRSVVIDGAFAAVSAGDRATHDRIVADAIERESADADVIVLAQASMASAAAAVTVDVPVLTSLEPGIRRLGEFVGELAVG